MQLLESKKTHLDVAISKLEEGVREWRRSKFSAPKEIEYKCEVLESKKILQKAKWTRMAIVVCKIALIALAVVATLAFFTMFMAIYPPVIPALVGWIGLGAMISSGALAGGVGAVWNSLSSSQAVRKARIIEDSNFTNFVKKYLVNPLTQFYPQKADLLDPKVHSMYLEFKRAVRNIA